MALVCSCFANKSRNYESSTLRPGHTRDTAFGYTVYDGNDDDEFDLNDVMYMFMASINTYTSAAKSVHRRINA